MSDVIKRGTLRVGSYPDPRSSMGARRVMIMNEDWRILLDLEQDQAHDLTHLLTLLTCPRYRHGKEEDDM